MTTETKQIEVPNFKATSDGTPIFTPKQWLENFRQYTRRKYKVDIIEVIRVAEKTQNGWSEKETEVQKDLIWTPKHCTKRHGQKTKPNRTYSDEKFNPSLY